MFKKYNDPKAVGGWLGWFVDAEGKTTAFVDVDYKVHFMEDLTKDLTPKHDDTRV